MQYNVIMIGAGHNGLTAAAYLAKAGRKVLMLEQREIVGGCAVTEEIDPELAPGCRVSTAAYIASMLRPTIIKDLKLSSYGLKMVVFDRFTGRVSRQALRIREVETPYPGQQPLRQTRRTVSAGHFHGAVVSSAQWRRR